MESVDYCSECGALLLKNRLERYWRERGYGVIVRLHEAGYHSAVRAIRFDVRSDMLNGFPRRALRAAESAAWKPATHAELGYAAEQAAASL